ncbi:sulfate transporter, partial [Trifolium medium]|nr:sulfate transporter [Trifolium medium]
GIMRHSLYNLKKVARLPSKDRSEVLKVLKKKVRHRRGGSGDHRSCSVIPQTSSGVSASSVSVNNDWKHWVVLQGNEQVAVDDVWGVGKSIGVKFKGDNVNMFSVLARAGKVKKTASGQAHGGGRSL